MRSMTLRLVAGVAVLAIVVPALPCQRAGHRHRRSIQHGSGRCGDRHERGAVYRRPNPRMAVEAYGRRALARSTEQNNETLTERVRDYPLQASVLLAPVRSTFSPYRPRRDGRDTHRVEQTAGKQVLDSTTTRRVGIPRRLWRGDAPRPPRRRARRLPVYISPFRCSRSRSQSDTIAGAVAKSHISGSSSGARFSPLPGIHVDHGVDDILLGPTRVLSVSPGFHRFQHGYDASKGARMTSPLKRLFAAGVIVVFGVAAAPLRKIQFTDTQPQERPARDRLRRSRRARVHDRRQLQRRLARRAQRPHRLRASVRAHDVQGIRERRTRTSIRT